MANDARETAGRSKSNKKEATVAKRIIVDLLAADDLQPDDIGVVTPYKAQVQLLKAEIQNSSLQVSVRTVDGFQGQEREVIVFSAVRCNDGGYLGFLDDDKRMNVLLTRARRGLIVIGNKRTLKSNKDSTWNKWVSWVENEELFVDSEKFLPVSYDGVEYDVDGGRREGRRTGRRGSTAGGEGGGRRGTRGGTGGGRRGGGRGEGTGEGRGRREGRRGEGESGQRIRQGKETRRK